LGESLAALVFFRDAKSPFTDDDESLLKQVSPIFAVSLASVVRGSDEGENAGESAGDGTGDKANEDDGSPFFDGAEGKDKPAKKKPKKDDPADWWKRGEQPPF